MSKKEFNKSELEILATEHANEFGTGWVRLPNGRATTKAAMANLRARGLVEYVVVPGWAGNRLVPSLEKTLQTLERIGWAARQLPLASNLLKFSTVRRLVRRVESAGYELAPYQGYGPEALFQFACSCLQNEAHITATGR